MEMIRLKYTGGKSVAKLYFNRVRYVFNKENDFITDVPLGMWNLAKKSNVFTPAPVVEKSVDLSDGDAAKIPTEETKPNKKSDTVCDVCGFKAKNKTGLIAHKRIKHKGGK